LNSGPEGPEGKEWARPRDYQDLLVWKKGIALAKQIYDITANFPEREKFGLVSQMRRAAVSVPSNIAEGQARHTSGEFVQFLSHAEGSVAELDTQLILSVEFGYCSQAAAKSAHALILELRKMLSALRLTVSRRS
jgi:four helix bundle protein